MEEKIENIDYVASDDIFSYSDINYTSEQRNALEYVKSYILRPLNNNGSIENTEIMLQGYAGTGKTTIIYNIVQYLFKSKNPYKSNVLVLAPTNKAVQVLASKMIKRENDVMPDMSTLHAALYGSPKIDPVTGEYKWVEAEPIINKVVIVDEASMLDEKLVGSLRLLCRNCLIVYSGDEFQLEPIGVDPNLFELRNKVTLTEVKRATNDVLKLATLIRNRKLCFSPSKSTNDITVYPANGQSDFLNSFVDTYKSNNDTVMIVATNDLRNHINTRTRFKLNLLSTLCINDKLMSIANSNFYKNGDMGIVEDFTFIDTIPLTLIRGKFEDDIEVYLYKVKFKDINVPVNIILIPEYNKPSLYHQEITGAIGFKEFYNRDYLEFITPNENKDGDIDYSKGKLSHSVIICTYGYCISCHKSQGSEFENVFVTQNYCAKNWSAARWFYTAITRSRNKLSILPNYQYQIPYDFQD